MEGRQELDHESQQTDSESDDPFAKLVRRPKDKFYDKELDNYLRSYCKENDRGCLLFLTDTLLQNILATSYLNSSYVYSTQSKRLVYIINGQVENVDIDNSMKLHLSLIRMMNTKSRKYEYKLLSYKEIYLLITSNGGHKPRDLEGHDIEKLFSEFSKNEIQQYNINSDAEELSRDIVSEETTFTKRLSNRFEDFFDAKNKNLQGFRPVVDVNPDETTVLYYLKNENKIYNCGLTISDYVFINELLELYIVRHDRLEHVKIGKMENFISQFYEIMDTNDYRYDYKCVPTKIIHQLILSNEGLIPLDEKHKQECTISSLNHASTTLVEHESEEMKNRFEIREMPIYGRYSNKEKWVRPGQTYYMPGLPICIKSPSLAFDSSQDDFAKLIQLKINTITNDVIFNSLPTKGTIKLFSKETDAKEYVRAIRNNIYKDLTCYQSAVFEISLQDCSKTSALKAGIAHYVEIYDGLKHIMDANVIFFEADITNVVPQKAMLTIESLKGKIAEVTCSLHHDNIIKNQLTLH